MTYSCGTKNEPTENTTPPPPYDQGPESGPTNDPIYITQQPSVTVAPIYVVHQELPHYLGPSPERMTCPNCRRQILTDVSTVVNCEAYVCCLLLFFFGCALCSCLPCCCNECYKIEHRCPLCEYKIGKYRYY